MRTRLAYVLRRRWPILVVAPLLAVVVVIGTTPRRAPQQSTYDASVLLVGAQGGSQIGVLELEREAVRAVQPEVLERAAEILDDGTTAARLREELRASVVDQSVSLRLTATNEVRSVPEPTAEAWARAVVEIAGETELAAYAERVAAATARRDAAAAALAALTAATPEQRAAAQAELDAAESALAVASDQSTIVSYEVLGREPVRRRDLNPIRLPQSPTSLALAALIASAIAAMLVVAGLEKVNRRVDETVTAEDIVGAPVLASVPVVGRRHRRMLERTDPTTFTGPFAEAFRGLRSHLDFRGLSESLDRPARVMVVSPAPREGKTTTTAFLALAYIDSGRDAVVIGADFRRPTLHRLFGVPRAPGLSSRALAPSDTAPGYGDIVHRDPRTGVLVVPSGPGTERVSALVPDLCALSEASAASGRVVLIDTAPVLVANDALEFLPAVDWVVVVVKVGHTTQRSLRKMMQALSLHDAKVAGCVLVGALEADDAARYYYSSYELEDAAARPSRRRRDAGADPAQALIDLRRLDDTARDADEPSGSPR